MQRAHFVIPDPEEAVRGLKRVTQLKQLLESGEYRMDIDYVEAKSLVTVAYIILQEVIQGKEVAE